MINLNLFFILYNYNIMDNTFFNLKLDLEPNIIDMIYDILRMSTIQLVTQTMFYMNNSSLSLFSETFIKTFVFINMSILFYYLVVRKLFSFVSDDYLRVTSNSYTPTPPMSKSTSSDLSKAPSILTTRNTVIPPSPPPTKPKSNSNTPLNNNTPNNNSPNNAPNNNSPNNNSPNNNAPNNAPNNNSPINSNSVN
jgi:hypothetical protein